MTRIVAIDTTSASGGLALLEDGHLIEEVVFDGAGGIEQVVFSELAALMQRHGWRFEDVHGFAAAAGPGSFTGVRVGLTAAKGMAETVGVQAAAISNLEALATHGSAPLRAPFFDARRSEVFCAVYDEAGVLIEPERALPLAEWLAGLDPEAELLAPDPARFEAGLAGRAVTTTPPTLAAAVGRLAFGRLTDPAGLDANYVRRSDADLHWRDNG